MPPFEEIRPATDAAVARLQALLPVVTAFGLTSDLSFEPLDLHHFPIDSDRSVVWGLRDGAVSAVVERVSGDRLLPILWRVTDIGELIPLEFISSTSVPVAFFNEIERFVADNRLRSLALGLAFIKENNTFAISFLPRLIAQNVST